MSKELPPFEDWNSSWQLFGWNNCFFHAADALDYLSRNDRPTGGEQNYNAIDLEDTAYNIRRTITAITDYKNRIKG